MIAQIFVGVLIWFMFVFTFALFITILKTQALDLLRRAMELYFTRRMQWLKDMNKELGGMEGRASAFN